MTRRGWISVFGVCSGVSLVLAGAMTFVDWRANPGGVFRDEAGTYWSVVIQTASSWFFPVLALSFAVAASVGGILWLVGRERQR